MRRAAALCQRPARQTTGGLPLALLVSLTACQPPPPPLSVDPRVSIRPDAGVRVATPPAVSTTRTGITEVNVELQNTTPRVAVVTCTTDWFDTNNQPVASIAGVPTRISIAPYRAEFCTTVAPAPTARNFRMAVDPSF